MNHDLEKIKEQTSKASLTQEEKFDMFKNIRTHMDAHPVQTHTPSFALFMKYSVVYATMFAFIIGTSATSLAAERSLPGDILYPIKTQINEKVAQTLTFSKKQKTQVTVNLVDKRMSELEKMIIQEKDTPKKINTVVQKLDEHKEDIEEIQKSETADESKESADTYIELESMIDTHIEILEDIIEDKKLRKEVIKLITEDPVDINEEKSDQGTQENTEELEDELDETKVTNSANTEESPEENVPDADIKTQIQEEDVTVSEIKNFSTELESIIKSARERTISTTTNEATTTKTREDTRMRILDKAEEELQMELEE